jgi:ATP-dependent Clp protease ATP-binding subunit ClpA
MGARPMARLIQDTVRRALADELLFGKLIHGGKVTIDVDEGEKVVLRFEAPAPTAPPAAAEPVN